MTVKRVVLFDLDGTITDSASSIIASLEHAFTANGVPALSPEVARTLLGPPFYDSLPPLVGDDLLWPVIEAYRAHYDTTMLQAPVYDGVPELLAELDAAGRTLAVASSKPAEQVTKIVAHRGLTGHFATIGGDRLDGSLGTKALVVGDVLARLGEPDPAEVVLVGDREHDVLGAREHGIECLGVRWGYAQPGELEAAGPRSICDTVDDLRNALS